MLRTKSVHGAIDPKRDGLRILASRFRGRGMPATWAQFRRDFERELFMDGPIDARSRTIRNHGQKFTLRLIKTLARDGNVTLLCQCAEDEELCHRHVLRSLIASSRV